MENGSFSSGTGLTRLSPRPPGARRSGSFLWAGPKAEPLAPLGEGRARLEPRPGLRSLGSCGEADAV